MMSMMSACQRHPVVGRSPHADVGSMLVAIMSRSMKLSLWIAVLLITSGCAVSVADKSESRALGREEAQDTRLGRAIAHRLEKHPGQSGIYTLADPQDAFAARALLARVADRTLDVQYYIWRGDVTGTLLISELHAAADRGVRVRLLLDDNGTSGLDDELSRLASHPLIEVRLFNPFALRSFKSLGYLTDFSRSNRRMHNKSFTADNQATIVGGRNVGDEYFAATEGVLFADLDVLSVGPVVNRVSADFDRYWASDSAYPVEQILNSEPPSSSSAAWQDVTYSGSHEAAARYIEAIEQADFVHELVGGDLDLEWARTRMISDDPAKGLGGIRDDTTLAHQLGEVLGRPERKVALISPYFVPTAAGVDALAALESRGVEVTVLTNSLDATDVAAVHAGYAKRRKALLDAGIQLFEMRRLSSSEPDGRSAGPFGSSGSSLHAKTFAVDGERLFVGSFNFDPRSMHLNTELGFVIESPALSQSIHRAFGDVIPLRSYQVHLDENDQLYWTEQVDGSEIRHDQEPNTGWFQRAGIGFLSILPIEWLL